MTITPSRAVKMRSFTCMCLLAVICATVDARAASLFGDFSCKDWGELEHGRKKTWANAFLAPLSLTIQGLKRAQQDPYNDDPNAVEPAIRSIDTFCLSHPKGGASDGAASYLSTLTSH
jgi:hypothetical protein